MKLVEAQLAVEREAQPTLPELVVFKVEEHAFGWLVYWQSADYVKTSDFGRMLVGHGPYLVDREDGRIHHIPVTTFVPGAWEELYRQQVKGIKPLDPLLTAVREILGRDGRLAALHHLRKHAPRLSLYEAKAYADALRAGGEPEDELVARAGPEQAGRTYFAIETLTGPAEEQPA
ncbi:YrhB domain-containing protein [Actinoplanes sp. NPDC023801]|uniref:YrhB domain-containing protein n=1 Tax=Actinoplanes sp. NPDC023801 TaxID=3154595 RepID=UPI0033FB9D2B